MPNEKNLVVFFCFEEKFNCYQVFRYEFYVF